MTYSKRILLLIMATFLITGCSKKNDEAAQLEKEYLGEGAQAEIVDSTATEAGDSLTVEESVEETPLPVIKEEPDFPTQPAGDGFIVQVAGCEDEAYASFLVKKYTDRGYEPFVTTANVEGQTYYRVRIGLFESFREAKALQVELNDKYSETTWIDNTSSY